MDLTNDRVQQTGEASARFQQGQIEHRKRRRKPSSRALLQGTAPPAIRLTVKLSGRPEAHPARRERKISPSARGAPPEDFHGPLQRLLEDAINQPTVRAREKRCNETKAQRSRRRKRHRLPARAPWMRQAKGLRLQLQTLHDFQDESGLRTLTVKLRGRREAPPKRRGRTLSSGARGA